MPRIPAPIHIVAHRNSSFLFMAKQYSSTMRYHFQYNGFAFPWLNLFQRFYSLWCNYTWDCFLNFILGCLLLLHINTVGFHMLSLFPAIFLNSFSGPSRGVSYICVLSGFSMYSTISPAHTNSFSAYGETTWNVPNLIWSQKESRIRPGFTWKYFHVFLS